MNDTVAMRVIEATAGLRDDVLHLFDVEVAAVAQDLRAGLAGHVLHHDEVLMS